MSVNDFVHGVGVPTDVTKVLQRRNGLRRSCWELWLNRDTALDLCNWICECAQSCNCSLLKDQWDPVSRSPKVEYSGIRLA